MHAEEWDTLNLKRKYIFILSTAYVQYNLSRVYIMGESEGWEGGEGGRGEGEIGGCSLLILPLMLAI